MLWDSAFSTAPAGIDQLGDMLLAMAGQNGTGWYDTMLVTSVQNNLFLLIAALLCCFPLLELPKKWMAKNPAVTSRFPLRVRFWQPGY